MKAHARKNKILHMLYLFIYNNISSKKFPSQMSKTLFPDEFTGEFYRIFSEKKKSLYHKLRIKRKDKYFPTVFICQVDH